MDLFGLIRVEVFVLLPVFLYFLLCKNSGRSLYTGRGIAHSPLKGLQVNCVYFRLLLSYKILFG